MKKYLLTGFITLLPIAVTLIVISYIFDLLTAPFMGMIEYLLIAYEKSHGMTTLHRDTLVLFISRVCVLIFLFLFTLLLGFVARKFFFAPLMRFADKIFSKIPFVKSIYRTSQEVTNAIFSGDEKTFKQTVLLPFPSEDVRAIGFITGSAPPLLKTAHPSAELSVFVPTSPHPLSGFLLLLSKTQVTEIPVATEDAFKFLISCGVMHPGEAKEETK